MNPTLQSQPIIQSLISFLETQPSVLAAIVFGSVASGRLHAESDLDLALLFDDANVPDGFAVLDLRATLEQYARRDVDVVVLNGASPILAFQAVKHGQRISVRDEQAYQRFVVRLISEYADFKRVRRPIEEAVLKRRVYARP